MAPDLEARVHRALAPYVEGGDVPGLTWAVAAGDAVRRGAAGVASLETGEPMAEDAIFRIASLTKPVTAVATLQLVDGGACRLDDAVECWLPELAERTVLRQSAGPIDDTVPAERSITVRDLLTFTSGYGYDFANFGRQVQVEELARLGLGVGPPAPATMPDPDTWVERLGTIPLDHQPGAAWRYHVAAEILGVLIARIAERPLGDVFETEIFEPLGMTDTGFWVATDEQRRRLTTSYAADQQTGERTRYDPPDGQWARPPAFPSGGGGLVSTADDFLAFGRALLDGGGTVLPRPLVEQMTTNQLDPNGPGIGDDGAIGWGFGVDVQVRPGSGVRPVGSYGWVGGLGSAWLNAPGQGIVAVLLTNQALLSPDLPAVMNDFWAAVF